MSAQTITYCPPAPQNPKLFFDRYAGSQRLSFPVEAHYVGSRNGINGWASAHGLGFEDYGRMQTQRRTGERGAQRRLDTPAYMHDEKQFREVVLRFLEIKAFHSYHKCEGTEVERSLAIAVKSKQRAEEYSKKLDKLSHQYVALRHAPVTAESAKQLARLQRLIAEHDTRVRILRDPSIIPTICRAFYYERLNSVGVGARVGLNSPNVRQILFRIAKLAKKMAAGKDVQRRRGFCTPSYVRAYRAVLTPQQLNCVECGRQCEALRRTRKFCSKACALRACRRKAVHTSQSL